MSRTLRGCGRTPLRAAFALFAASNGRERGESVEMGGGDAVFLLLVYSLEKVSSPM
jgi:hypothetical protein